jgi:hypothetical protein
VSIRERRGSEFDRVTGLDRNAEARDPLSRVALTIDNHMKQNSVLIASLLVAVLALCACSADSSETEAGAEDPASAGSSGTTAGRGAAGTAGGAGLIGMNNKAASGLGPAGMNGNNAASGRAGRVAVGGVGGLGAIAAAGNSGIAGQVGGRPVAGAPSNAGAGAVAGASGSSAASIDCNVSPVNPNATKQAKNLLCYMYSQYGNHVLSGQQETSWSNPEGDIRWYTNNGMKPPAIMGGDYLYLDGTSTRAIAYWNAGGITMIRYHMGAPPNSDTYENSKGSTNIDNVLKEGTAENTSSSPSSTTPRLSSRSFKTRMCQCYGRHSMRFNRTVGSGGPKGPVANS